MSAPARGSSAGARRDLPSRSATFSAPFPDLLQDGHHRRFRLRTPQAAEQGLSVLGCDAWLHPYFISRSSVQAVACQAPVIFKTSPYMDELQFIHRIASMHRFRPASPLLRITSAIEWPPFTLDSFHQPVAGQCKTFRPEIS